MSFLKIRDARAKNKEELLKAVKDAKQELLTLRVQKQSNNAPASKIGKIRVLRKNVARILTVLSHKTRDAMRQTFAKLNPNKLPKNLRPKLTHRRRLALSRKEKSFKSARSVKKASKYPVRKFAVKL
jgi:large subunit ribosomal protein L35e